MGPVLIPTTWSTRYRSMPTWRLIRSTPQNAFVNMAVDEAIFKSVAEGNSPPTLRFYTWDPPAVSVGYFQDPGKDVDIPACRGMGIDVVRRMTGGRAVLHDQELTYSLICRDDDPLFPGDIMGTYKVISSCLVRGLNSLGIDASLTPVVKKSDAEGPSACFSSPSHYEITVSGKKLVGSAQRRGDGVFIQHGSVLTEFDRGKLERILCKSGNLDYVTSVSEHVSVDFDRLLFSLRKGFEDELGISFSEGALSGHEISLSESYGERKYMLNDWNLER